MKPEDILQRTEESIVELFEIIKSDPDSYGYESDVHFDLYFLLNHKNFDSFWETKSIQVESQLQEKSSERTDLIICDPDQEETHEIIAIEIKYNSWNNPIKRKKYDGTKYREIEWDFYKFSKIREKYRNIILIFIYVKNTNSKSPNNSNYEGTQYTLDIDIKEIIKSIKSYKKFTLML